MDQESGIGRDRLSRRQRRDLDQLERELVADVDLCRWFDRLANDVPSAAPNRSRGSAAVVRAVRSPTRSSRVGTSGVVMSTGFALVLCGAALTVAAGVLQVSILAVPALIVFLLAPVSVLVVEGCCRRYREGPATRPVRGARPGRHAAAWPAHRTWNGMEGGMWLLP